jgi:hypothetical protein
MQPAPQRGASAAVPLLLPMRRTARPRTALGRWLLGGGRLDEQGQAAKTHPWYRVLWLTGVDYFSTLGYQPGIALLAAGLLSPLATVILVIVTVFGALPVYREVARRSFVGQGSIAMLENLLRGWSSKIFVLILLGFAATDFVITMTLSAADAARHAIENPYLHPLVGDAHLRITLGLLLLLAVVFFRGFSEAIELATLVTVPYLLLNVVVLARCVFEVLGHPELWSRWHRAVAARGDWSGLLLVSALIFPKLALGLSGFETGVSVMPLVTGSPADARAPVPEGRIRATRRLLEAAALIMSVLLLLSSAVSTLLIPEQVYRVGGPAAGRALAYLAHRLLGDGFGTVYDLSTIAILWFAGASAMAGLLNLVPRYLPRFGMAPSWAAFSRPLVIVFLAVNILVTIIFNASVEAQGGAYATGVLVLIFSAAVAVALAFWREAAAGVAERPHPLLRCGFFCLLAAVFAYTLAENVRQRPDGAIIAGIFILSILALGFASRHRRSTEMRVSGLNFADQASAALWPAVAGRGVHLVPIHNLRAGTRRRKAAEIKRYYHVSGPFAFVHVSLVDNRSEFLSPLLVRLTRDGDDFLIEASQAVAIANSVAYISEALRPLSIFVTLTRRNLTSQALHYLFWGEGETGLMIYMILVKYWEWTHEQDLPLIFLMSESPQEDRPPRTDADAGLATGVAGGTA